MSCIDNEEDINNEDDIGSIPFEQPIRKKSNSSSDEEPLYF